MDFHEQKWLADCPAEFALLYYKRYVDDCFLVFRNEQHALRFLNYLNSKHRNISFTMEVENNKQLPFLDVLITKCDNSFSTTVYRKPTFSGLGISYFSFCYNKFKLNSIKSLVSRAYSLCSSFQLLNSEFSFIKQYFKENGFRIQLVERVIASFLNSKYNDENLSQNVPDRKMYVTLPYFGQHSIKLKLELSTLFRKYFQDTSSHVIFVNPFTIGSIFSHKETLLKEMRNSLVY